MKRLALFTTPWVLLIVILIGIAVFTALGPAEKTLGTNARVVYLHGAWVWAALAAFIAAGVAGLAGLITRKATLHRWSRALGRTGLVFWITYLPISMWAMQANWNGLFLAEPRWRMALIFGITGLLVQIGITLLERPVWASLVNLAYVFTLFLTLSNTENVMHPPSPMLDSNAPRIQIFFFVLVFLTFLAAWQVARWWRRFETPPTEEQSP